MPTQQRATADALVDAFNRMDNDAIVSFRHPNCTRQVLPVSLKFPPQSNTAYRTNLDNMKKIFSSFKVDVHDVIEDVLAQKIVMFVTATGQTRVGLYRNEYVWKMTFDGTGKAITDWVEFVDVGMARDFLPKLQAEMKKVQEEERTDRAQHS
ncbi:hypothetical protein K469DRAFT_310641 [Zopfia rhizophila CBS 207.26]|uniref:SnoaL-like domain-containing protein n=1 Tax=Zopfia rhizophila CBS 207.26 TaxID=1314779 RepID=A0A6A6ER49_9PEZI|nr:hypothetical protein K469DRAFT_310641 [Zopfia rhizophila CBS 207.26]